MDGLKRVWVKYNDFLLKYVFYGNCIFVCFEELVFSRWEVYELKKVFYFGFVIFFDNLDICF